MGGQVRVMIALTSVNYPNEAVHSPDSRSLLAARYSGSSLGPSGKGPFQFTVKGFIFVLPLCPGGRRFRAGITRSPDGCMISGCIRPAKVPGHVLVLGEAILTWDT